MKNTIKARSTANSLIKAGELIDVLEVSKLTLQDRLLFNELLRNCWNNISSDEEHAIHKSELTHIDKNLSRLEDSISRLIATQLRLRVMRDGDSFSRTMAFLTTVDNCVRDDGFIYYKLNSDVVEVVKNSNVFARIKIDIMYAMGSKYSLALYEVLAKRVNLEFKQFEDFDLETLRSILGVSHGKLTSWNHLRDRCLQRAVDEVNLLTDIGCAFQIIKSGRRISTVRLLWWGKDLSAQKEAMKAREAHSVVRKSKQSEYIVANARDDA